MNRRWIVTAAAALALFSASAAWAKPGVIKTKDGRTLEGDVAEKGEGMMSVTVRGIATSVPREEIESIQYVGTIDQQYQERLAKLPKSPSAKDHLELARWLFDNKAYELARKETDAALSVDPNNAEATTLYTTIQSQMKMEKGRSATGMPTTPGTTPPRTAAGGTTTPPKEGFNAFLRKYLSLDDINLVKQAEWPKDDKTAKVTFANDVKRKYVASQSENAAKFNALPPTEQARMIFDNGAPDLRKDIKILNDPAPMAEFKRSIQPMILTGCATAACHGGPSGGKFFLYSNPENDAATYTNFYLLTQTSASIGGAKNMMFDRIYPDASLIAEWGLPVEVSKTAHPDVKGTTWRPMFRGKQDPSYQTVMKWLNKLVTPEPKYGFSFSLDGKSDKPATQAVPGGDAGGPANAKTGSGGGGPTTHPPASNPPIPVVPRVPPTDPRSKPAPAK